jgi:hypothetical protein
MRRLFTFGCSFTEYVWPTWADLLSTDFDHYENWGYRGLGNRGIAERVAECHAKHTFSKDDVVIIQWSSHLRFDWYHIHSLPDNRAPGWKTSGSMFGPMNRHVFNDNWINMFFYEPAYIMHTLNTIIMIQGLLKSTGATWFMTSIGDIRNLGTDINVKQVYGESLRGRTQTQFEIENDVNFNSHVNEIWNNNSANWLDPIHTFVLQYANLDWWFTDKDVTWKESHPSTLQYSIWIKEVLATKLSISKDALEKIDKVCNTTEQFKESSTEPLLEFAESILLCKFNEITWPNIYKGF